MSVVKVLRHGQITLPKTLREILDIKEGDLLEIELEKSHLIIKTKVLVDRQEAALGDPGRPGHPVYQDLAEFSKPKESAR
ncbi:MAG: AbrB/MazE/SpoVT family DNA-binding domain-containing protein [Deltaproteobacteria bacterium]|nr:AbrB/MazE/SpoVT family DNA-binding domain-containing protein [Deltaproteobacteria bacterium]